MQLKQLLVDDNAVSPVIGVILMVAVTVILAAVLSVSVLDLGASADAAPQAQYGCGGANGDQLTHRGGDELAADDLSYDGVLTGENPYTAGDIITDDAFDGSSDPLIYDPAESDNTQILTEIDCTN